jgi:protein-disulfide isomerase
MKMRGLTRWLCALWLGICLAGPGSAAAQVTETEVRLTLDPAMVKGSPNAPVIIVEFSDYQ